MAFGLLGSIIPQINRNEILYQSPSNTLTVGKISVSSKNYNPAKIRIGITTDNIHVNYLEYNKFINYGECFESQNIYIGENQTLVIRSNNSDVNFLFYGQTYDETSHYVKSGLFNTIVSTGTTTKTLFTVPANANSIVTLSICNLDSQPAKARIGLSNAGLNQFDSTEYLEYDVEVGQNQTYNRTGINLTAGQTLVCSSSNNSRISFSCHGQLFYSASEDLSVLGDLYVGNKFSVDGPSGDTSIQGLLSVGSTATIGNYLSIGSTATIGNYLSVGSTATIGNSLSVGSTVNVGNSLNVANVATIGSSLRIGTPVSAHPFQINLDPNSVIVVSNQGNLGIGTVIPISKLSVIGDANISGVVTASAFKGDGFQLTNLNIPSLQGIYELDSISPNGDENTYTPSFNYETVSVTDPFKLLITINGVLQSAYVHNTEYVHNNSILDSCSGYTIDYDGNIKFSQALPAGGNIIIKTSIGETKTDTRRYPFKALDILF